MKQIARLVLLLPALGAVFVGLAVACGGDDASPSPPTAAATATLATTSTTAATTVGTAASASKVDLTRLPIGDSKVSTTAAAKGSLWSCRALTGGGGAGKDGPWIRSDGTWDSTAKAKVSGEVAWPTANVSIAVQGDKRVISGNGLPSHTTGVYPVASTDAAYVYDRNPNTIKAQTLSYSIPANPTVATAPSCTGGEIGLALSGVAINNAIDGQNRDAVAHEVQDSCSGHPQERGIYHYHSASACAADAGTGHSALIGYAFDGFGIFGFRGEDGKELTNADLDECHGHTHEITWDAKKVTMYHYHSTHEFPYTVGCYRGTASNTRPGG